MKKIAIVGANEQQDPLIQRAKERGFETHVFAWQTGGEVGEKTADFFYPISAGSKEEILKKCMEIGVNAVASIGSDIAALTVAYCAEKMGLVSNSYSSVVLTNNKLLTRRIFEKCGIPQPAFCEIDDRIPESVESLGFPLVVKPGDRSGGRGVRKVENPEQLYRAINEAREISFERKAIVEKYVEGQLYSCECISFNGEHKVLGYTKRQVMLVDGKFCEYRHESPANISLSVLDKLNALCIEILSTLGLRNGASSIEFILDKDKNIYVIEVTPTMYGDFIGTDLIPASAGYDYLGMVLDIAEGNPPDMKQDGDLQQAFVKFVYSKQDLAGQDISGVPEIPNGIRYAHYVVKQPYKEFGGTPPLSLRYTGEYYKDNLIALNSEYTAFWYALKVMGCKKIHVPYYISGAWERVLKELDVETVYYHIDENFLPLDLTRDEGAVLLINFNAMCSDYVKEYAKKHGNVIIDNSMAFFAEPVMAEGVYNIYSCRKFFAVADGAYLVSRSPVPPELQRDISYKRVSALVKSLELGEGAAYKEHMANGQALSEGRTLMSSLTKKMLCAIDYEDERAKRRRNFDILHSLLGEFNLYPLNSERDAVPQFYPLLVNRDIRNVLVSKKIYTPTMWRKLISERFEGTYEKRFSEKMLYLPIDQWYSESDMEYVANIVISLLS